MTTLDIASDEVVSSTNRALRFLNMKVNCMFPFELLQINSATKNDNGHLALNVNLKTKGSPNTTFVFELNVNPAGNNPDTYLVSQKQLSP